MNPLMMHSVVLNARRNLLMIGTRNRNEALFSLATQGVSYRVNLIERINTLNDQCSDFVLESERQLGIRELKAEVVAMKAKKAAFLDEFDTFANREQRRADHRKIWMG
jgi:hypothetical protein